jgi:hypothetical protein
MKVIASIFALGSALVVASTVFAAEPSSQPLTRVDCDKAGMGWDEGANVCVPNASRAAGSKAQTAPKAEAVSKVPVTFALLAPTTVGSNSYLSVLSLEGGNLLTPMLTPNVDRQ